MSEQELKTDAELIQAVCRLGVEHRGDGIFRDPQTCSIYALVQVPPDDSDVGEEPDPEERERLKEMKKRRARGVAYRTIRSQITGGRRKD